MPVPRAWNGILRDRVLRMRPRPYKNLILGDGGEFSSLERTSEVRIEVKPADVRIAIDPSFRVRLRSLDGPDVMRFSIV